MNDADSVKKKPADHDYSFEPVPTSARKGFLAVMVVMLGFTFNSTGMAVGAKIGVMANLDYFVCAMLLGGLFLAGFTGLLAYIGTKTGMSFDQLAQRSFGFYGSKLPSLLLSLTQIGWFGVCSAMFAIPVSETLHCSPYLTVAAAGFCMTGSAYVGFKGLEIISYIAVPLIIVLGCYSVGLALETAGSIHSVFTSANSHALNTMIGLVIGSFISGGCSTPNFTRFARNARTSVISTVAAFLFGNSLMIVFGAVGGAVTGKDDIFYVMMSQGLILSAVLVLGANIWTTNDNALYSSGLSLANIVHVRKRIMVLVGGFIGTVGSFWLYENMLEWLTVLSATLPAVGIILILDYFFFSEKYLKESPERGCIWSSVSATICGLLAGNLIPYGCSGVNSLLTAAVIWSVWNLVTFLKKGNKKRFSPEQA